MQVAVRSRKHCRSRQSFPSCIHCHSRYVRPDVALSGPASDPAAVLAEKPVLIGNRRHGPDLANVGARRSATWLKQHFLAPRDFAPDSPMPSYTHLFDDSRGDDLIACLRELPAGTDMPGHETLSDAQVIALARYVGDLRQD